MIRYSNHTQKRKLIFSYMNKLSEKHARYNFFKKSIFFIKIRCKGMSALSRARERKVERFPTLGYCTGGEL